MEASLNEVNSNGSSVCVCVCVQPELYLVASLNSILCPAAGSSPWPSMQSMAALSSLSLAWAPKTTDLPYGTPCILEERF